MKVYFSGISGTGIGPLAELAQDCGFEICGSDLQRGAIAHELEERNVEIQYGPQDGEFLKAQHQKAPIDWLVYTSALPADHAELRVAAELGIKATKRDEFLAELVEQKELKMLAVAGTHGKTTTTAMIIWAMQQVGIPVNYLVGTTLSWGAGAHYEADAEYLVYEADEYDRNFLAYHPYVAAITCVDYDHPDIYPTREEYQAAFTQFKNQSKNVVENTTIDERINLVGELRRQDASIALAVIKQIKPDCDEEGVIAALNDFPGAGRRFERIAKNVYSDYGHHPSEIAATVKMAIELKQREQAPGLAIIYQPHQNVRQHEVYKDYKSAFVGVDKLFWLPTYLTRENPDLTILTPEFLIGQLENAEIAEPAIADEILADKIRQLQADGWIIVMMTAGPADGWLRSVFSI